MSHEVESNFYVGETPWHGLGVRLDNPATSEEAILAAGLNWEVGLEPVAVKGKWIDGYKAIVRNTDNRVYAIVHDRYTPIQNKQAFEFFDSVVGTKEAIYHTAGSLKDGARIWILAKLTSSLAIKGDQIDKYILLSSSHDASKALQMFLTPIRVVCMNTLRMAEAGAGERFYARHTKKIGEKVDKAREILGLVNQYYVNFKEQAEFLASKQLPPAELPKLLVAAFNTTGAIDAQGVIDFDTIGTHMKNEMAVVTNLFTNGKGNQNPAIAGTRYAAMNGISEYTDHYCKPRGKDELATKNNHLNSVWFGGGAAIKQRAWDYLINLK